MVLNEMENENELIPTMWPYEYRVLVNLYDKPYFIKPLNHAAKVAHSPVSVEHLRDKGLNIISEYKPNPESTPFFKRRQLVEYTLHPNSRGLALQMLHQHQHPNANG